MESRQFRAAPYSVRDVLTVLFKFRYHMAAVFTLVVLTVGIVALRLTPVYEAKSTLLIKIGREYLNKSDPNSTSPLMSLSQGELTNSEIQILTNHNSVKKVITAMTLKRLYPDLAAPGAPNALEEGVVRFQKGLTVQAIKQSNVLEVSFRHPDPQVAAQAVTLLVEVFKEKHLQVFSGPKSSFVETQLSAYERKLKDSEDRLQSFKQQNRVFSIEEQRSLLLKQRADLDGTLMSTESSLRELESRIPALRQKLSAVGRSVTPYAQPDREKVIEDTKAKLLAMQLEEQQLLKKYTEANPLVVNFRKEIRLVKDYLRDQERALSRKTNRGNAVYQSIEMDLIKAETDLTAQRGRSAALRQQLKECDAEIKALDLSEKNVQDLKRQQAIDQKNYETYVTKAEEARISEDMDRLKLANISVIQEAIPPSEPVDPRKSQLFLRGVLAALLAAVGFAFLAEAFGRGLSTPEAVERRLGLRVLATISHQEG